jgi:uncharacterized protein YfdQ (DUF2303 family)
MSDPVKTATKAANLLETALENAATKPLELKIADVPHLLFKKDLELKSFEGLLPAPVHLAQNLAFGDADSLLAYYNRFADSSSTILADMIKCEFKAILDYHGASDKPAWGKHIATYNCPITREWKEWESNDKKNMNQVDFARFIENRVDDIAAPDDDSAKGIPTGVEMLQIALTLEATEGVDFRSSHRLEDGQVQLKYNQTIEGRAGATGELQIPKSFDIGLRLFEGGTAYRLKVRFRYRINNGTCVMWYELINPHKAKENAMDELVKKVRDGIQEGKGYLYLAKL